ncbi:MAG: vacuolar protein sorting family 37 protein [bacterium]|nr:vacuolar protein sorting family 37 protein [bacterium]
MRKLSLVLLLCLAVCYAQAQVTTGYFGGNAAASGHPHVGNTTNQWIKVAELTLNGNYNAAGITIDLFPKNANHGDSRQQVNVQFRNNNGTGIYTSTYDIALVHFHGQHKTIKDVKVVHTSGTAVSMNKLSVWVQMGISWLSSVPIEVRKYGNVTFETTNQPYYSSITETGNTYGIRSYTGMVGTKFEVGGTVRSKEVKVETTGWPDYVFKPEYSLRSIEEVEQFINENGHLPNIPSEAEVMLSDGVELGKMNVKLLEKIEELTLYTIDLNKSNKRLAEDLVSESAEIQELKNQLEQLQTKYDQELEQIRLLLEKDSSNN